MASERTTRFTLVSIAAAAAITAGVGTTAIAAGPPADSVVVTTPQGASVSIDLTDGNATNDNPTLTVGLDSNCPTPLNSAQTYTILPSPPTFVTVAPAQSTAMHCGDTFTFTVSAVTSGGFSGTQTGSIVFSPVVSNKPGNNSTGIQNKVAAGSADVTVIFPTSDCTTCTDGGPGSPAAAPAIANAYLDAALADNQTLISACQAKGTNKGKTNWRGVVISYIAQDPYLMPGWVRFVNFGVDPNDESTWGIWSTAVENEVNAFCGYSG